MRGERFFIASAVVIGGCFPGPLELDSEVQDSLSTSEVTDIHPGDTGDTVADVSALDVDSTLNADTSEEVGVTDSSGEVDAASTSDSESDVPTCEVTSADELCNGIDDNCNDLVDEGFGNIDGDDMADCVDPDDDDDLLNDEVDPDPRVAYTFDCGAEALVGTHRGCVFWSVDAPAVGLSNPESGLRAKPHVLAVINDGPANVDVQIASLTTSVPTRTVGPLSFELIEMPVVPQTSTGVANTPFRVVADAPISVVQMNPYNPGGLTDATVLLPEHTLGTDHVVASWDTAFFQTGFMTVVATQNETLVTIKPRVDVPSGPGVDLIVANQTGEVALEMGQSLTVYFESEDFESGDPTGTQLSANHPIAVFSGNESVQIGGGCCSDRLETQLLPSSKASASEFHLVPTKPRANGSQDFWRIVAYEANTVVWTSPLRAGIHNERLAKPGDWLTLSGAEPTRVSASHPIAVFQYLSDADPTDPEAPGELGGPALFQVPPVAAYGGSQHVLAFEGYENHVTVIRPTGSPVSIDGETIPPESFVAITPSSPDWEYAWVDLAPGLHLVRSSAPIGLAVHGYGTRTAYAMWAGFGPGP
ncbi:MAG: IgGFc-binding protein [Deltaproteobacteria bacterium]|nr:IgGFc-binding protein [Deltaproteobacteria bacterium]